MKNSSSPLLSLLFLVSTTIPILAQPPGNRGAPRAVAPEKLPNWDEKFDGVVHDANNIAGFVGKYRWLSNFFLVRFEWVGRVYGSAEAAYHSGKYPVADRDIFTRLSPVAARNLSRTKPFDITAWESRKVQTMRDIVWSKFSQNPKLARKLLATGGRYLEETNWWGDKVWGVYRGDGQNLLGKILMDTRARLANESAAAPDNEK
jgi:ribA/ribD-fused uncharacterized protein